MDSQEYENRSSLEHKKFAVAMIDTVSKFRSNLCFKTIPPLWVRIVNGVDKYVTESMLTKKEEDIALGKPIAKARPRQKPTDSGEERVTAKSKPMMNFVARTPSFVSSSISVSPGKRYYGKQDPWSSVVAKDRSIAKLRPRQKPTVTLTSVSIPVREREWIDIETQRSHDQKCYEVSEAITRLLRHDQTVPRGSDGAIQYNDIVEECRKEKFDGASQWSLEDWM